MTEPTSSTFWRMALQSGLISEHRLRECWEALPSEGRVADKVDSLLFAGPLRRAI